MSDDELSEFGSALASLVSKEISAARQDPSRISDVVERLASSLGFTIALSAAGDGKTISKMVAGAEAYIMEEATEKAPAARALAIAMEKRRA